MLLCDVCAVRSKRGAAIFSQLLPHQTFIWESFCFFLFLSNVR